MIEQQPQADSFIITVKMSGQLPARTLQQHLPLIQASVARQGKGRK